ncbi:MAG: thiamine pyrophosphate-dependent dehydrogenase E1 component subunit alpha [Candidatus Omnitrophica bacterium]|nr:thiamine pyrophosphate-dependent dehydrogenase E1 component subunit alpha [Candidatus Omnitrophota bacterium]MDE2221572.1 thiamine pyrophosphate-dependent dehydrogenase E1 component subunit alpha [Candidatus Omnitrophota bacterium]
MSPSALLQLYYTLVKIRRFEEKIVELYPFQRIRCPVHLCIGQEAIAAGVCAHLKRTDFMVSTHRNHGHLIAKGAGLKSLFAEIFGKIDGCSRGKGGSMHMIDPENSSLGTSSIVAAGIPMALGTALASKLRKQNKVSVVFFGDGAVDQGAFFECLNFASLHKLAVVFVCENNAYSINSPQKIRQVNKEIHKITDFFRMPGLCINGNDVIEVWKQSGKLVDRARRGHGPSLMEAMTFRHYAHVGIEDDTDKGFRDKGELKHWAKKCPLKLFKKYLIHEVGLPPESMARIENKIEGEIREAVNFAVSSPFPGKEELGKDVY